MEALLKVVMQQVPGLVAGGALGFLGARLLDRARSRDARLESVRVLVSMAEAPLKQLQHCLTTLDDSLLAGTQSALGYFKIVDGVLTPSQASGLHAAIQSGGKLDQQTLVAWRTATDAIERAQRTHDALRVEVRVAGEVSASKAQGYRQALLAAKDATLRALTRSERHSDSHTTQAILRLCGGD